MRTTTITLYQFDELDESAKDQARDWFRQHALDYDWWDHIYDDAKRIGLVIESFDLDRNRHATGFLNDTGLVVCRAIMAEHGESCRTYATAQEFLPTFTDLQAELDADQGTMDDDCFDETIADLESELDEATKEFEYSLLEDYSLMLQDEYEYQLSDEQVDESIRCNAYDFDETGRRV